MKMALADDGDDNDWLHSLLLDVQLEHFHTRIIDELQVSYKKNLQFYNSKNNVLTVII